MEPKQMDPHQPMKAYVSLYRLKARRARELGRYAEAQTFDKEADRLEQQLRDLTTALTADDDAEQAQEPEKETA